MATNDQQSATGAYRRDNELSLDTRDERWARVRRAMSEAGIEILVTPPNPGFWDQLQANATYLSTIGGHQMPVSVVFPLEGEVTAVVGGLPPTSFWHAWQTWLTDVRVMPWTVSDGVVARLRELGADGKRIGVPGLSGTPRFPDGLASTGFIERLKTEFPNISIVDATEMLDTLRNQKTQDERRSVAEAVAMAVDAFEVFQREARPGVEERVVYGKMVGRLIERGSMPPNFLMWKAGANFGFHLSPFPTGKRLLENEPIWCEIEARSPSGYIGQITRTAYLGKPGENLLTMTKLCHESFTSVLGLVKPGSTMGDVLSEYAKRSAGSSYKVLPVIHARALGEDRPMIIFDTTDPKILAFPILENQVWALKVQVRDEGTGEMAFWGDSVAVGPNGAVRLSSDPLQLTVID
jgi:Xaa-Pro aminopeptidase